jgi:hypothetical protein
VFILAYGINKNSNIIISNVLKLILCNMHSCTNLDKKLKH